MKEPTAQGGKTPTYPRLLRHHWRSRWTPENPSLHVEPGNRQQGMILRHQAIFRCDLLLCPCSRPVLRWGLIAIRIIETGLPLMKKTKADQKHLLAELHRLECRPPK